MSLLKMIQRDRFAVVDGFLSRETCTEILGQLQPDDHPDWVASTAVPHGKFKGELVPAHRLSRSLFSIPAEVRAKLLLLEMQIENQLGTSGSQWEGWQVTHYPVGGRFNLHHDTGLTRNVGNERLFTVLICLQEPQEGGHTEFPKLGLKGVSIPHVAGRLLTWCNLDAEGKQADDMIHAGRPVLRGEKICLTNWIHEKTYC